ncbi:MAG: MopE-related protein [bacterium]
MGKRMYKRAGASFFLPLITALSLVITSTGVVYAAPSIVRVEPNYGNSRGGTSVTIEGAGFAPDAVVLFGGHQAMVTGRDGGRIVCTAPPGLGHVPLNVINGDGSNDALSYEYTLSDSLYIDDHQTGPAGEEVHFSIGINNAPEDVTAFGFDILFDPNVLKPVSDPNKPDSIAVLFTRGELAADFKFFAITYTPGNSYLRVGGFTEGVSEEGQSFITKGVSGVIATVPFTIHRKLGTATLNIVGLDDDVGGWSTRPGHLFSCPSEVCDGKDNDCDGEVDEECVSFYADADEDGFGDPNDGIQSIDPPEGYVSIGGDCDDTDGTVYPEAPEVCDGKDNDCDGVVDGESIIGCVQYYRDADGDGYGVIQHARCLCAPEDLYQARRPGDCDDADPDINPGAFDPCGDEDMNCDGITDCAILTGLVMDPNRPGVNPLLQGVRLTLTRVLPRAGMQHIIDPNGLVLDPAFPYYRYAVTDLEAGVYEARIENVDEDPNTWRYQPARISLTLLPGETRGKDFSLVSIPEGEGLRSIMVLVSSPGEEVTLTLKELVMKDGKAEERTIERITKGPLEETVQVNGYEPPGSGALSDVSAYDTWVGMNSFEHTFVLFHDANCRVYAESKGYRRVVSDVLVTNETPGQVELTIHEPGSPSLSVNRRDADEGRIGLTISYRDAFGRQGIWSYGKQPRADVKIALFAPADDADRDGWPDPDRMPGGDHLTGSDMERTADPNDPQRITRLEYILDPRVHHMTVEQGAANGQGDPNVYVVAFTIELLDPEGGNLLGPLSRRVTVSPAGKRTVGEVLDTLDCSQVMSMGVIRVEGVLNANGEETSATAFMDAASIDPAFLFDVPSGTAGQVVGPDAVLDLAITCAPDPRDPDVTVIDIALRNDQGTAVEYNPTEDPDAPPLILEIPLVGSLQAPDVEFWDATRRAVIKFIRLGGAEVFTPGDGEYVEFYISDQAVYMARIITRHTSEWYSTAPPENFVVTTEGLGAGEVTAGWDPVPDENMDLDEYRVYYGTSPDIDLAGGQYEPVPPGGDSCLISGLRDQTLYSFVLVAVTSSGDLGVSSPLVTAIPGTTYTGEELHAGTEVSDYQIVTYPVVAANPDPNAPENFLDDLGENDPQQWRLWWWDSSIDDYDEFPDIGAVVPGKAFFLIARNKGIIVDIPGRPVQTSYAYDLRSGWNLIGSPYPFDISWQEVLADPNNGDVTGRLYGGDPNDPFNGAPGVPKLYAFDFDSPSSYRYEDEVMEAGVGYWIRNTGDPAVLRFEPKVFLGSIEKRFRPVSISSESPPAPPGSETTPREQGIGGCFIGLFEENWHIAVTAIILVILGACALVTRRFGFPGKGGLGPFLLVLFLCGVSILLAVLCAESAGNVTTYIDARKAFQAGEYERAEKGFRGVIDVYPGHAYAHRDLGLTLVFMNRPNEALDALRKAFVLAPRTRLALESQYAAGFLFLKSRKRLSQSITLGYMYDDNVTLYPEEEPTGRYDSIGQIRYTPQLRWYIPGLRGFNTLSVGYMIDSLFYDRRDERDLQIQLLIATWTYMRGTSRTTLLATYHSSHLDYDRYTNGPGIGFRWAHDFAYRMTAELGGGYEWQNRVQERTKDKETAKGLANVRFYSPARRGYVQVEYVFRDDREKEGLTPEQKYELTSGTTHQYEICVSIPKSFILPLGFITAKGDWSAHRDVHSFTYSTKRYDWLYHTDLSGGHREDDTYVYEFRHTQPLFRNALSKKGGYGLELEVKYSHRHNDSNIDDVNPGLMSRDYHRNIYALGLTCRF